MASCRRSRAVVRLSPAGDGSHPRTIRPIALGRETTDLSDPFVRSTAPPLALGVRFERGSRMPGSLHGTGVGSILRIATLRGRERVRKGLGEARAIFPDRRQIGVKSSPLHLTSPPAADTQISLVSPPLPAADNPKQSNQNTLAGQEMNTYDFADRAAVVTGGARGIGAAIADRIIRSGGTVAVWDVDPSSPDEAIGRHAGAGLHSVAVDITDAAAVERAAKETADTLGGIDVLVNSAGIAGPTHTLWDYPLDAWRKVQSINVDGTFHTCRAIVPAMREKNYGRIVNIASIAGKEGNPNASAYSASKAAVIAITKSLGKELADKDIAVNCVTPATAATRILEQVSEEFIEYMRSKIPRGRFVTVEEVASMVCWLASAENSFTTGGVFDLSGGRATY